MQINIAVTQTVLAIIILLYIYIYIYIYILEWFPSFQYSFNDWCFLLFLFFRSFFMAKHPEKFCSHCVGKFHPRLCIYDVVKTSNVFYLHLWWSKSLFQIIKKCAKTWLQWIMYCSEKTSKLFHIYLVYKNSQVFEFTTLKCFSCISLQGL